MNHCVTIGCGNRCRKGDHIHCLPCLTALSLRDWRFVTPAMRRWRAAGVTADTYSIPTMERKRKAVEKKK